MPKISACIVAYCDYDEVCAAVRSVLANTPGDDFALYVVDNATYRAKSSPGVLASTLRTAAHTSS